MRLWAIIPIKPFERAKTRLAAALSPDDRAELAERWFRHVLAVTQSAPAIAETLVISSDAGVLALAAGYGAKPLHEAAVNGDLNAAWRQATSAAGRADALLLLPGDLPFVCAEDIAALAALAGAPNTVVIAPDQNHEGTNALLVRPPGIIDYAYGVGSFKRHLAAAQAAGARTLVYESEHLIDIDVPDDLALYYRRLKETTLCQIE